MKKLFINTNLIKKYIKDNNLTTREFCKKCDITYSSYLKIMKSTIKRFKPIYNVSIVLNVKLKELLGI